jgi:hypothetical protein
MAGLDDVAAAVNELAGRVAALTALEIVRGGLSPQQIDAAKKLASSLAPGPLGGTRPAPASAAIEALNRIASACESLAATKAAGQEGTG